MLRFPSVLWFEELRLAGNSGTDCLRCLGAANFALVVKIDFEDHSQLYEIAFSANRCTEVRELWSLVEATPNAFVLEGPFTVWREMIENIHANRHADFRHRLDTLTRCIGCLHLISLSQIGADRFYRYEPNLQQFFDHAAVLETCFPETVVAYAA
jgi:hypothetical protein